MNFSDKIRGRKKPPVDDQTRRADIGGYTDGQPAQSVQTALLTGQGNINRVTDEDVQRAQTVFQRYKSGKQVLEARVVEDEEWYRLRHWQNIRKAEQYKDSPAPSSAWLFNAIINKHADAMDNYPDAEVLPREQSDEKSAKTLSQVLPVVMEYNKFHKTYSDAWYSKLKHGTCVYGVFWNAEKDNGLGDIEISEIDLLNIYWEPGIDDIQKSRNLFITELVDADLLASQYPQSADKLSGCAETPKYASDDSIDTTGKVLVIDWYYKVKDASGKTVLHYAKFTGGCLLYASQNDPAYASRGFYDHGMYPVVFDTLFPEKLTPAGFGYVSICRDPQLYIDKLYGNILETSLMGSKRRYFASESLNINEEEFKDWNNPIVKVSGTIDDSKLREIVTRPLDSIYVQVAQLKIDEMKDTAANRDVNSGGTGSGVTAAAAISALQEAGNKVSRDMIDATYRAYEEVARLCIELMRQFYDEARSFRVTGNADVNGGYQYVELSNAAIGDQQTGVAPTGEIMYRHPIFDLKVVAHKKNPFSRMEQNQRAIDLYGLGFFNPERAQESVIALEMMEFEGKEKILEQVKQGATLLNLAQALEQENAMLKAKMGMMVDPALATDQNGTARSSPSPSPSPAPTGANTPVDAAKQNMTSYGQKLAQRSTPSMEGDVK